MKDGVKSSHFTKFDTFRVNRDQVIYLQTWFKIQSTLQTFVWTLKPDSRSTTWSLFTKKASDLIKSLLLT